MASLNNFMQKLGSSVLTFLHFSISLFTSVPEEAAVISKHFISRNRLFKDVFIKEVYHCGFMALPVIIITSALISSIFVQLFPFERFAHAGENIYGSIFTILILRELTPVVVLIVIAVRSTIYITIQITQMKIGGEVHTLELLGIDPYVYLGSMRVFAGVLICPILGGYFALSAIISAGFTAYVMFDTPIYQFINECLKQLKSYDYFIFFLKMSFCGYLIYKIAVYNGMTAKERRNMIISRTIRAITQSVSVVIFTSFLFSVIFYGK